MDSCLSPTATREHTMKIQDDSEGVDGNSTFLSLPVDMQDNVLAKLPLKDLFICKMISKQINDHINRDDFCAFRGIIKPTEQSLTALSYVDSQDHFQLTGYDVKCKSWVKLPPVPNLLPRPDPGLFKDFFLCGDRGMMCMNLSKSSTDGRMIVFNPLIGRCKELPTLQQPRNPVLLHIVVDKGAYKVIAAGSARASHSDPLAKTTEVFDSSTGIWTITDDLPAPLVTSNDHQTGVYMNGILYCIAFLEFGLPGVLAFSVKEGKWLPHLSCPLPISTNLTTVQLVESNGELALFSEIERANTYMEHRIDVLEEVVMCTNVGAANSTQARGNWRNVVSVTKAGSRGRGLLVYPEFTCVPFGEGNVCIFDTILHTGVVYHVQTGNRIQGLPSPIWSKSTGKGFFRMNPLTFSFEPSFKGKP